jgi:hypothetical protein
LPADRTFAPEADPGFTQVQASVGRLSLMAWRGQGGLQPDLGEPRDAFQQIAAPNQVQAARLVFGQFAFTAEGGFGERLPPFAATPRQGPSYARVDVDFQGPAYSARIGLGDLNEPLGPLGSTLTGVFAAPSSTRFLTVGGDADVGASRLYGEASIGRTSFTGAFLRLNDSLASSWRLGLVTPCMGLAWVCSDLGAEVAQPLRFEGGEAVANLAEVPAHYFDPLVFTRRGVSLAPSGRELDLRLFADHGLGAFGLLRLEATAASDRGNVAGATPGLGLVGSWRVSF